MEYILGNDQYGVLDTAYVVKIDDDGTISHIPNDPKNKDWQAYQAWLAENSEE